MIVRIGAFARIPLARWLMFRPVSTRSDFIRQEAERFGYPYVDMSDDFPARLEQAEALLTGQAAPGGWGADSHQPAGGDDEPCL